MDTAKGGIQVVMFVLPPQYPDIIELLGSFRTIHYHVVDAKGNTGVYGSTLVPFYTFRGMLYQYAVL